MTVLVTQLCSFLFLISLYLQTVITLLNDMGNIQEKRLVVPRRNAFFSLDHSRPNMITLMGFMFLVTSSLLGYIYSPQLDSPPPRWVHFAHGLLLFLYQTFDAVDGKQARRTNSSSPLGELFDHGCDALACAFEAMAFASTAITAFQLPAYQLGQSIPLFSWVPFVNEIQTSRAVLYMMIAFAVIPTIAFNVSNVYKVVQSRKGSMVLALAMLYPFVVLLGGVLIWDYLSPINLIATYPHLVVLGTGLAFGFLVGRMILAHLCDEPKGLKTNMCMSLLYLPFALANALTARLNAGVPLVDELWVLLGYCIFTVSLYLHFATSVIHEITEALGIYCFRITRKEA
ncbi:choline/ethanolaminephosphotransferase 1 [Arabidopsis lyrata subsp. lyrata]|uniref:choline/ethanolaminephosphotransferase 1 n=1 Tax=Arabidopsis lyrata subsp. lyrata TaxID=81972 RepID=UPI000A29D5AB|nr:choline/ethanolaminephosphotransferase 1 [Arabidopsis lyrata subsp. lyrata]|eukprot:XP_020889432.1 choline/ethanolaminephosphotransferase 1 [Arabidopsis lyrata subsp. lyrata]